VKGALRPIMPGRSTQRQTGPSKELGGGRGGSSGDPGLPFLPVDYGQIAAMPPALPVVTPQKRNARRGKTRPGVVWSDGSRCPSGGSRQRRGGGAPPGRCSRK
jgi:hypothetical protein